MRSIARQLGQRILGTNTSALKTFNTPIHPSAKHKNQRNTHRPEHKRSRNHHSAARSKDGYAPKPTLAAPRAPAGVARKKARGERPSGGHEAARAETERGRGNEQTPNQYSYF